MCGVCDSAAAVGRAAAELTAACAELAGLKFQNGRPMSPELHHAFALPVPVPRDMARQLGRIRAKRKAR